jgi:hypothetical protein
MLCVLAVWLPSSAFAQVHQEWRTSYGGPVDSESGDACAVAGNGEIYVSATITVYNPTTNTGSQIPHLLKLSSSGALLWDRTLPVFPAGVASLHQVLLDANNSVYVLGAYGSFNDYGTLVVKYDTSGVWQWSRTIGGGLGTADNGAGVLDAAGNLVVVGSNYDYFSYVRSYSPSGSIRFDAYLDLFPGKEGMGSPVVAPNGDIIAAGATSTSGFLAKFDAVGVPQWTRELSGANYSTLALDPSGRIAVGGFRSISSYWDWDAVVALYDMAGVLQWSREYADPAGFMDSIVDVAFSSDGAIWAVGSTGVMTFGGGDILALRYDEVGNQTVTFVSDAHGLPDKAQQVIAGEAGQVWLMARSNILNWVNNTPSEARLIQLDAAGGTNWTYTHMAPAATSTLPQMALTTNRRIFAAGSRSAVPSLGGETDADLVQFDISDSPQGYCTPKINSLGCTPNLVFIGMPSVSATSGFTVRTSGLLNQKNGLYFYGTSAASVPFQGGIKCVAAPIYRGPIGTTNGAALPANDCSGILALDFNALASGALGSTPPPALSSVGTDVYCQAWTRDPSSPSTTDLSSALRYTVLP